MLRLLILFFSIVAPQFLLAANGLSPIRKDYGVIEKDSELKVTNMPPVRSQDTLGICYSFVASTLFDQARCAESKPEKNCAELSDDERSSPLDMAKFSQSMDKDEDLYLKSYGQGIKEGGSVALTLLNGVFNVGTVAKESCSPFDQVVAKVKDPMQAREIEAKLFENLKLKYKGFKDNKKKDCQDCDLTYATALGDDLSQNFNIKKTNVDMLKALSEDSYEKFLETLLVPEKCLEDENRLTTDKFWNVGYFPKGNESKPVDYNQTIEKVKDLLKKKRPLSVEFCAQDPLKAKKGKDCQDSHGSGMGHAVVIKGYRRVCKTKNPKDCYDAVQIQNSWGESWQQATNGGWVDAKELLSRTFFEYATLSWLE